MASTSTPPRARRYLRALRKHVRVDSFGACLNSNKSCGKSGCDKVQDPGPPRVAAPSHRHRGVRLARGQDSQPGPPPPRGQVVRAADYKFVFAFENSKEPHYVTEKVQRVN